MSQINFSQLLTSYVAKTAEHDKMPPALRRHFEAKDKAKAKAKSKDESEYRSEGESEGECEGESKGESKGESEGPYKMAAEQIAPFTQSFRNVVTKCAAIINDEANVDHANLFTQCAQAVGLFKLGGYFDDLEMAATPNGAAKIAYDLYRALLSTGFTPPQSEEQTTKP